MFRLFRRPLSNLEPANTDFAILCLSFHSIVVWVTMLWEDDGLSLLDRLGETSSKSSPGRRVEHNMVRI